jgi:hypothetical protein
VPGLILATATSDNTPGGAILTFAFPLGLFVVIVVVLYLLLARPHRRVPAALTPVATSATATAARAEVARGASVAAGLPTAVGGGGAENPVEPAGGVRRPEPGGGTPGAGATAAGAGPAEPAADTGTGGQAGGTVASNVSGQDATPADNGDPQHRTTDGTEASE